MIIMRYNFECFHFLLGRLDLDGVRPIIHQTPNQNGWRFYHIREEIYLVTSLERSGVFIIDFLRTALYTENSVTEALLKLEYYYSH